MRYFLVLLVLLVCVAAYMRDKEPDTWNSWMTAAGMTNLAVSPAPPSDMAPASVPPVSPSNMTAASASPASPSNMSPASFSPAGMSPASAYSAAPAPQPVRSVPVGGLVKEGDFASGGTDWEGDGRADPSGKGLAVILNSSSWTRVYQSFTGDQRTIHSIEVTYRLTPGITVSQNPSDYVAINKHLQIPGFDNFGGWNGSPGNFYGTVGDPNSTSMSMEVFSPQYKSTQVQDYQHTYPAIPPNGNVTFALAFPPGSGTVTLLTAYVMSR